MSDRSSPGPHAAPIGRWLPGVDAETQEPLPRPDDGALDPLRADLPESEPTWATPLPWALPACADTLRRAGDELARSDVSVRIAGLCRVARSWLDPDDDLRLDALARLPAETGLSPESVAWGLDRGFEVITRPALERWWRDEGGRSASSPRLSGHVQAGNVFTAGLPPVIASVLAGVPALIKAPSAAPSFPLLLARSFALHAPELGPCVGAASWSRDDAAATQALVGCVDTLFVFGDDASIAALRSVATVPLHGFGHRVSLGFVARGSSQDEARATGRGTGVGSVEALAADLLAWDGGGCLSPRWVVVEGDLARARAVAEELAGAMEAACLVLPPGPISEGAGAARASWLGVEGAMGWAASGPGWAVSCRDVAALDPAPPGRCVAVLPLGHRADLASLLSPLGPRLQGLALVGSPADGQELGALLRPLGLSRVAPAGRLQIPDLVWNHDHVALLPAFG